MIRILEVVNNMHRAGLETMLMNYYRRFDRQNIQMDFLTHRSSPSDYDEEIRALGGKVYYAPRLLPQNMMKYHQFMRNFFKLHPEYQIVHSHIDSMSYLPLREAKRAGVPIRIAHSHNTSIDLDLKFPLKEYYRTQINKVANYRCACGKDAGDYLFHGKAFTIIPNAIEATDFLFNPLKREVVREKLNLKNQFVVGHVGRFTHQKNHVRLLKIFFEIKKVHPNSKLLLIGVGEKLNVIREEAESLGILSDVLFLGNRSDVNDLYQAMDTFVMPSFYEGIPVVGIEAQFSGLPCIFSDRVPVETDFSGKCSFISLSSPNSMWAEQAYAQFLQWKRRSEDNLLESNYRIENATPLLESLYYELNNRIDEVTDAD